MALDSTNVLIGSTGRAYVAPLGSAAPTDAATALDAAYADLGYLSDDGITEAYDDDVSEITAFQGGTVVRRVISSSTATVAFTMIETKADTLELFHKGSTVVAGRLDVRPARSDRRSFLVDIVDNDTTIRLYIPNGEVTERGEITYSNGGDAVSYPVTITAYPVDDVVLSKFSNSAVWV